MIVRYGTVRRGPIRYEVGIDPGVGREPVSVPHAEFVKESRAFTVEDRRPLPLRPTRRRERLERLQKSRSSLRLRPGTHSRQRPRGRSRASRLRVSLTTAKSTIRSESRSSRARPVTNAAIASAASIM